MLTEEHVIDSINATEFGTLEIRCAQRILRDGDVVSQTYHRTSLNPGDDLSGQDAKVIAIANAVWTPEVIAAYQARMPGPVVLEAA